jgi:hypothetical protein
MASHFRGIARDDKGNTLDTASVYVYETGTTTQVSIFEEEALSTPITQPIETDSNGNYEFWAAYQDIDILVSLSGFTSQTVSNLQLGNICDIDYLKDTINAQFAYGELYVNGGATTKDVDTANGWVLINVAMSDGEMKNFDTPTTSRLRYTGATTKRFRIAATVTVGFATGSGETYDIGIGLNGNDPTRWQGIEVGSASDEWHMNCHLIAELAQNEYAEIFMRSNVVGATAITIEQVDFNAHNVDIE